MTTDNGGALEDWTLEPLERCIAPTELVVGSQDRQVAERLTHNLAL